MYGDYFRSNRRISSEGYDNIVPGTPIVISNPEWGAFRQFAIFVDNETIIYQKYIKLEDGRDAFEIQVMTLDNFTNYGKNMLFEYIPNFKYNQDMAVDNALSSVDGNIYLGLRSIVGDDFVLECMVGSPAYLNVLDAMRIGYHISENRRNLFKYQHHGITIEGGYVIHFAVAENGGNKPVITMQKLEKLHNPKLVYHDDETIQSRIKARNRALLALIGVVDFHDYNLVTNNCEHFANWCKTGKHRSKQVYKAIGTTAWLAISLISRRSNPLIAKLVKDYLF